MFIWPVILSGAEKNWSYLTTLEVKTSLGVLGTFWVNENHGNHVIVTARIV